MWQEANNHDHQKLLFEKTPSHKRTHIQTRKTRKSINIFIAFCVIFCDECIQMTCHIECKLNEKQRSREEQIEVHTHTRNMGK